MGNAKSAEEGTPETSNDGAGANPKINTSEAKAKKKLEQKLKDAKSEKSSKSDKYVCKTRMRESPVGQY